MYKLQFQKIDPYDWLFSPGLNIEKYYNKKLQDWEIMGLEFELSSSDHAHIHNKILHVHTLTMVQMSWRTLHQAERLNPWSNSDTGSWKETRPS